MKKMKPSRLSLHRETIQRLDTPALGGLLGGAADPPSSQICCPPDTYLAKFKLAAGTK
jgi:hypothetical protein